MNALTRLRGVAHWAAGRLFGVGWCDRCHAASCDASNRHARITTDEILCYACWRRDSGEAHRMSTATPDTFNPLFRGDGRLIPFEARLQGGTTVMTVNPEAIAYLRPDTRYPEITGIAFIGAPEHVVQVVCPYAALSAALRGGYSWIAWERSRQ